MPGTIKGIVAVVQLIKRKLEKNTQSSSPESITSLTYAVQLLQQEIAKQSKSGNIVSAVNLGTA